MARSGKKKKLCKPLILRRRLHAETAHGPHQRERLLAEGVGNKSEAEFSHRPAERARRRGQKVPLLSSRGCERRLLRTVAISVGGSEWLEKCLLADGQGGDMEKAFSKD